MKKIDEMYGKDCPINMFGGASYFLVSDLKIIQTMNEVLQYAQWRRQRLCQTLGNLKLSICQNEKSCFLKKRQQNWKIKNVRCFSSYTTINRRSFFVVCNLPKENYLYQLLQQEFF